MSGAPGPLLASGRACDVYALGEDKVLRRYRSQGPALLEASIMQLVAECGFPVPTVHEATGTSIVMERIEGPTMLADLTNRPWRIGRHARTLARLHAELHAIPAPEWLPAPFGPGEAILHLDLHPLNVICAPSGPVVIDWTNVARGPSGADVARTWIILAAAQPPGGLVEQVVVGTGRGWFRRTFVRAIERAEAVAHLPAAARYSVADPNTREAERRAIRELVASERGDEIAETLGRP